MLCRSKEKELSLKTIRHRLNSVSGDANEENYIHGNGESTIHPGKERSPSSPTREHSTFGTLFSPNGKGKGEGEEDGSAVPGVWLTVSMHSTFEKVKVSTRMLYVHVTYVSSPFILHTPSFIVLCISPLTMPSYRIQFYFLVLPCSIFPSHSYINKSLTGLSRFMFFSPSIFSFHIRTAFSISVYSVRSWCGDLSYEGQ